MLMMRCVQCTPGSDRIDRAPEANPTFDAQGDPTNKAGFSDRGRELSENALARLRHGGLILRSASERRPPAAHDAL